MPDPTPPRKPKLHAGCVEIELCVEPPELAEQALWREATTTPQGAQLVLTDEGPWLRLASFATWPVRVEVPTRDGDVLELLFEGTPELTPPPLKPAVPHIRPPARHAPVEPEQARLALMQLRTYMHSFAGARSAPEDTRDAIVHRVGGEMAKAWDLVRHTPDEARDELCALFDEITAAMPAARDVALERA